MSAHIYYWVAGVALVAALVAQTARLSAEQSAHVATVARYQQHVAEHNRGVAEAVRDLVVRAAALAADTYRAAQAATAEAEAAALARQERIRYVTRTIEIPAGCPVHLPDGVHGELAAAVDAANAAAGALRARPDPVRPGPAGGLAARRPGVGRAGAEPAGARAPAADARARVPAGTAG